MKLGFTVLSRCWLFSVPSDGCVPQIVTPGRGAWKGPWGTATGGAAENSQAHAQHSEPLAETGRRNSTNSTTARHVQRVWIVTGEARRAGELLSWAFKDRQTVMR